MSPDTGNGWRELWITVRPEIPIAVMGGIANVIVRSHHIAKEKGIMKKSIIVFSEFTVGSFFAIWAGLLYPTIHAYLASRGYALPGDMMAKVAFCSFAGGTFGTSIHRWVTYHFFKIDSRGKNENS